MVALSSSVAPDLGGYEHHITVCQLMGKAIRLNWQAHPWGLAVPDASLSKVLQSCYHRRLLLLPHCLRIGPVRPSEC